MNSLRLSFASISWLSDNIAELQVDAGVDVSLPMVQEMHDSLSSNLQAPFGLLMNKRNAYSYTFDAQLALGVVPGLEAIAVITYTEVATRATQTMANLPRAVPWNLSIFHERQQALDWLQRELQTIDGALHRA